MPTSALPTILFGAFDRHNLGDLLFPHVAARLLDNKNLLFAGLVERDLRSEGGHLTRSISQLAQELAGQPVNLLHAGGELLTCDVWQAAVMVQAPAQVQPLIQRLEGHSEERERWAHDVLGNNGLAPYALSRELFPHAVNMIYTGVGGVELNERNEGFRSEVIAKLKEADYVSVRDQQTWAHLHHFGITAHLVPDPVAMVAELFSERIEKHARSGAVATIQETFASGYLAFQFSADFGDDATLVQLAAQLDQLAVASGMGIVLFRAGAAPWHDELKCYQRLVRHIKSAQVKLFALLNIWDICALIVHSRAFCGSSLHGRIVAMAFGVPRVNLHHPDRASRTGKQMAYAATWELPDIPHAVEIGGIAAGIQRALTADREQLLIHAQALVAHYLDSFTTIRALLDDKTSVREQIHKHH